MARNNKNTFKYKTDYDLRKRTKEIKESMKVFSKERFKATKQDIENVAQGLLKGRDVVLKTNVGTVNSGYNNFNSKSATKTYEYSTVTKAIQNLYDNNFYNIISGDISSSEDTLIRAVTSANKIKISNQKGTANENLNSLVNKYHTFQGLKDKKDASLFVYDLETLGGLDANDVWRPNSITEFSMHEYGLDGSVKNKTDIVMGMSEKEGSSILKRIESAIKDGTIEYDEELRITAGRLSLYGDKRVKLQKNLDTGYFETKSFIDTSEGSYLDLKRISAGIDEFIKVGKETSIINGVPADKKAMVEAIAMTQRKLNNGNAMIAGYNDSLFDLPIMNYIGNKYTSEYKQLNSLFENGQFTFNPSADKHIDMMGAIKHYRNNYSTKDLLGDAVTSITEDRINRQEHYVKALYEDLFKSQGLNPHEASSDVTALSFFFTQKSDNLKGKTLFDFIGENLETANSRTTKYSLAPGQQILEARNSGNGTWQGKNLLNFAIDKSNGNVYTADNHMIRNGVAEHKKFNVGVGINKGQMYQLHNVQKIDASNQYLDIVKEAFPQYTSNQLYAVSLDMMTDKEFTGTRLDNLRQMVVLNGETELEAFLGNTFNVAATKTNDGFKIVDRDAFDIREYDMIKGKPVYKDVHNNYAKSDNELIADRIKFNNQKLTTSRAENSLNGDSAYRKITQALEIQELSEKTLGKQLNARELNYYMSNNVAAGKMAITIDDTLKEKMQAGVKKILEWKGELYDSTIDNMSTYMDTIANNNEYYTKVIDLLDNNSKFNAADAAVKKEIFKRVDRHNKELLAEDIYSKSYSRVKKSILGDESLQAPLSKFKNMYEFDLSKIPGAKKDYYYDITQANPGNLLRMDLSKDSNNDFNLVSAIRKTIHGDKKIRSQDSFALDNSDFRKFIGVMIEDKEFKKSISTDFFKELSEVANEKKTYNHIDTADRIIKEIQKIKEVNPLAGIKSKELYMKDLTSSSSFTKALNSDKFLDSLDTEINGFVNDLNLVNLSGDKIKARSFVEEQILKHYVPNNPTELVHRKATEEMTNYLTEIVHSIDKIGATTAVNNTGDLVMSHSGKETILSLPKILREADSDIWYLKSGNMENKLINKLNMDIVKGGYGIDMNLGTNFGTAIGNFPISKSIEQFHTKQGPKSATKESMDQLSQLLKAHTKKIQQSSTINGFNGNDITSNRLIDVSSIANVMESIFGENGKLNYLIKDKKFLDTNLQEVLGKDVARYIRSGKPITELDANMNKDLLKNLPHLLDILQVKSDTKDTEVEQILKQISFTGNVKESSNTIGVIGDMPLFSPQAALDNLQRPPILQAGNAMPIRLDAVKKLEAEGSGVLSGNLISSASIDKVTMRHVTGVGETTTDVMMDIAYVSTNALEVMKENHMTKVLAESNVDVNKNKRMTDMFAKMSKMNTYEQERHLDGRIAERLYGLMPAKVQNISASKDMYSAITKMSQQDAYKQVDVLTELKGSFSMNKSGVVSYQSATGKYVKRGDSIVQTLGFGDKLEAISPKMKHGVFLHKYQKTNGMELTDLEINKIINKNKNLFIQDGKLVNNIEASQILDNVLETQFASKGVFRIQDIGAAGFIKPTTSSTEKGMTNLNYLKTGTLDKGVDNFFKSLGLQDITRSTTVTDEGVDALLNHVGTKKVKQALANSEFSSIGALKKAINVERNAFNEFMFKDVMNDSAHMLVNDGVFKHGGAGQQQFGILSKAIDNLIKKNNGDTEHTLKQVTDIIQSNKDYQFLESRNLKTNESIATAFSVKDGRIHMKDMGTNLDDLTISNVKKLENLITKIDDMTEGGLVHKAGYIQEWDEEAKKMKVVSLKEKNQKLFGEWITEEIDGKKVYMSPITKESVKLLPDVETETGTERKYFEIKETLQNLKSRKNSVKDPSQRQKLVEEIAVLEQELRNYESVSKRMSIGTTEFQLMERIRVTDQHAQEMQDLIAKGELSDKVLASEALKGRINRQGDKLVIDDKLKEPVLDHWLKRFKGQLTYNPLEEHKLTAKDVAEGAPLEHLSNIYERSIKYGYDIGQDSADKIHTLEMAEKAVKFNREGKFTPQSMVDAGFEVRSIDKINFETDEIAKKNLLIDLGEEFSGNRYIAVAGTGHKLGQDDEILTNGQKQIRALSYRYDEWKKEQYGDNSLNAKSKVSEQTIEAKKAIENSIYGKNAYSDSLNKIQVDDVNYRYKASGAVTSEFTPGLSRAIRNGESKDFKIDNDLLDNRYIDGKSLSQLHSEGVHYDYKFVSTQAMENMGMFDKKVMKGYGANNREEMIDILKKTGTMDMTDRYPNNKNDSLLLTHVFLDEDLVGNQTKVAGVSGLKMNLDHDGDSVSSFALRYKNKDGSFIDYGMFANKPQAVKKASPEAFEAFSDMLATTTIRGATENHKWLDNVNKILVEDIVKSSGMGDLGNSAVVPGGNSVLGRIAPAGLSRVGDLDTVNANEDAVNNLISNAGKMIDENEGLKDALANKKISADDFTKTIRDYKPEEILDKALTVMETASSQGLLDEDTLKRYQTDAIQKIATDKYAMGTLGKSGLATTGSINVATNSIKKAAHDTLGTNDSLTADLLREMLDIPEQEAISYKKVKSAYNDVKGRDMSDILNNMFDPNKHRKSGVINEEDMTDLRNWYKQHANSKVEDIYDMHGTRYLDKNTIKAVEVGKMSKTDAMLNVTTDSMSNLSGNEYFQAKRLNYKTRGLDTIGAGHSRDTFGSAVSRLAGFADDSFEIRDREFNRVVSEAAERQANARQYYQNPEVHLSNETVKQGKNMMARVIDNMTEGAGRLNVGSGLAMSALGLAGGLMAAGYASGNPLNNKQASQVAGEMQQQQPVQTMSVPDFMDKQGGFVTGNSQQGYIINIKADTKKGRRHMQKVMKQAAEVSVGGAVSVNMNIRSASQRGITDADIENFLDRNI